MEFELQNFKKEVAKRFKNSSIKNFKFPLKTTEKLRLGDHRGGYVLPMIYQDLSKETEKNQSSMVKNILANISTSSHKFEGKIQI